MQQEQFYNQTSAAAKTAIPNQSNLAPADELPQCCGTGCVVCVLDYPELFSGNQTNGQPDGPVGGQVDSETLAMLEAIEQAQLQADRLIAETNSEMQ